jgi:MFS transporter, CP family, cyanate transporter
MQPGLPTLVREWLPSRIALGTVAYSSGMVIGATLPPVLTIPYVLPSVGGSWRLDLVLWAIPAILIAPAFYLLSPKGGDHDRHAPGTAIGGRWWPNWRNPLIWLIGLTFGSNNSPFFATNAFLGDYLASRGQADFLASALGWLNGAQIFALGVVVLMAHRMQRRAWPFLLFGPVMFAAFLGLLLVPSPLGIVVSCGLVGIATAVTMTATLALPPLLSAPGDVPSIAAGVFTVAYTCAIIIPTLCGALWDATGKPWTAFMPLCVCSVTLTVLGAIAARFRPAHETGTIPQ